MIMVRFSKHDAMDAQHLSGHRHHSGRHQRNSRQHGGNQEGEEEVDGQAQASALQSPVACTRISPAVSSEVYGRRADRYGPQGADDHAHERGEYRGEGTSPHVHGLRVWQAEPLALPYLAERDGHIGDEPHGQGDHDRGALGKTEPGQCGHDLVSSGGLHHQTAYHGYPHEASRDSQEAVQRLPRDQGEGRKADQGVAIPAPQRHEDEHHGYHGRNHGDVRTHLRRPYLQCSQDEYGRHKRIQARQIRHEEEDDYHQDGEHALGPRVEPVVDPVSGNVATGLHA